VKSGKVVHAPTVLKPSVLMAIILIVLGLLAAFAPLVPTADIVGTLALLLMFNGATQLAYAAQIQRAGTIATWSVMVAGLYLGAGLWFLVVPLPGLASVFVLLIAFFFAEGFVDSIGFFVANQSSGSAWVLYGGLTTMLLTVLMRQSWTSKSSWVLSTLAGCGMCVTGITRLLLALTILRHADDQTKKVHERRAA
jgi:uncharacterized membrane protein HdeD (DUF308 family)